jgi:hypothetical protein
MEFSVKQCLRQRICSKHLLAWSLLIWGIPSQILFFPKVANSLPNSKQQEIAVSIFSEENDLYEVKIPEKFEESAGSATAAEFPEVSVISFDTESQSVNKFGNLNRNAQVLAQQPPLNESGNPDRNTKTSPQQPSVSELSDVQSSDWAYQALRSLMERYGILSGYPDHTFRGNRPMSRYEFAAGLLVTMDKLDSLIANGIRNQSIQEDLITLQRLQREYRSALDDLQKRLNKTDDRMTRLEANRFSATTKLQGQAIVAFTQGSEANSTIVSRERLNLLTSFNSKDLLLTQLESGNNGGDAIARAHRKNLNLLGTSGLIASGGGLDYVDVDSDLRLRRLYYSFRPVSDLSVTIGAKMSPRDFIDRNKYANNEAVDFSSSFFLNNPLIVQNQIDRNGGAGVALSWNPGGSSLTIRSLYIAADANLTNSNASGGLFKDKYQASAEVEYSLSNQLALRLQYTRAQINNTDINAFGVNAEYALNRNIGVFTRLGFGSYQGFNTAINQNLDINPFSWAVGFGIRNLMIPGTFGGLALGQPFVTDGLGNTTQTNIEAFYNLELSDNVSITPTFSVVTNANNDSSNKTIWQGALRTVISF